MNLLIDTNLLYYLSGVSLIDGIDIKKLKHELSNYELLISKWTLVEIISNTEISEKQKETILEYIAAKKIKYIPIIGTNIFDSMPQNLADIIYSPYKKRIINSIIDGKKKCETEFMACFINSVISIFSSALYYKMEAEGEKDKGCFMFLTQSFIMSNNDFINSKVEEFIHNFYLNKDETLFKSEIDGFIYILLYANTLTYIGVKHGYLHDLFPEIEILLLESEKNELSDGILSSSVINSLLKKLGGKDIKNFTKKIGEKNINKALSAYKSVVGTQMLKGICIFILAMIEKMLSEGMKITKNDIIDSLLLEYYPQLQLFTFDDRFQKIIKVFDEQYYNFIIGLENKCRI